MRTSTIWSAFCCTIFPAVNYSTRRRRQYKYFGAALDARITEADTLRAENLMLFADLHNRMVENTAMINHNLALIEDNRRLMRENIVMSTALHEIGTYPALSRLDPLSALDDMRGIARDGCATASHL